MLSAGLLLRLSTMLMVPLLVVTGLGTPGGDRPANPQPEAAAQPRALVAAASGDLRTSDTGGPSPQPRRRNVGTPGATSEAGGEPTQKPRAKPAGAKQAEAEKAQTPEKQAGAKPAEKAATEKAQKPEKQAQTTNTRKPAAQEAEPKEQAPANKADKAAQADAEKQAEATKAKKAAAEKADAEKQAEATKAKKAPAKQAAAEKAKAEKQAEAKKATRVAAAAPADVRPRSLYLAVGHGRAPNGRWQPGAEHPGGALEADAAQIMVDAMVEVLKDAPGVQLTFESGNHPNMIGSVAAANAAGVQDCIEVHQDTAAAPPGAFAHWYPGSKPAHRLANGLISSVHERGVPIRADWHRARPGLYFLRKSTCRAVLVEIGRVGDYGAEQLREFGRGMALAYLHDTAKARNVPPPS